MDIRIEFRNTSPDELARLFEIGGVHDLVGRVGWPAADHPPNATRRPADEPCLNCGHDLAYQAPEVLSCPACGAMRPHAVEVLGVERPGNPNVRVGASPSSTPPRDEAEILRIATELVEGRMHARIPSVGGPGNVASVSRRPNPDHVLAIHETLLKAFMEGRWKIGAARSGALQLAEFEALAEAVEYVFMGYGEAVAPVPSADVVERGRAAHPGRAPEVPAAVRERLREEIILCAAGIVDEAKRARMTPEELAAVPRLPTKSGFPERDVALVHTTLRMAWPHLPTLMEHAGGLVNYCAKVLGAEPNVPTLVETGKDQHGNACETHMAVAVASALVSLGRLGGIDLQPFMERAFYAAGFDPKTVPAPGLVGVIVNARTGAIDGVANPNDKQA